MQISPTIHAQCNQVSFKRCFLCFVCSKNAVEMAKSGSGPNVDVVYKAGGKSVEELTGNV